MAERHNAEAIKAWEMVHELAPQNLAASTNLGSLSLREGRYDKAVEWYTAALKIDANSPEAHFGLGAAYSKQEKTDLSITEYRDAIRLNSHMADAYNNLGVELEKKGRIEEAKEQYRKALQVDPENAEAKTNLHRFPSTPEPRKPEVRG